MVPRRSQRRAGRLRQAATKRLMLIEFFPGALRRNEKGMLFPFLKGLAQECGHEALRVCFGGTLAPAAEGYGGRMLRARLADEDLRTLARHLDSFCPTHVVTSDLLGAPVSALLDARTPPPEQLVMPTVSDLIFGSPEATGMARPHALISADPDRRDYLGRGAWFLDWLGVKDPVLARRHLVPHVAPDYAAVMANAAALTSESPVSIVSGGLCGNRRGLVKNRCFAGVDLGRFRSHRGCSFCMSATMPPYTPWRVDPLALWERQFRRILETASPGGETRGIYEFFDYRAFRRIDEVAALVLRLGLPPSVLMFNPRIDEVLHARERLERVLPALAGAGHEVRILSMGVENFSETENTRLNKGITLDQVDEFLALARRWEVEYPGVFMPFKAGRDEIELGFILFTPWTTPADLRFNLECAAARRFSPTGYWLYSTLDIQEMEPMYRLAQQAGDLLVERFPDRGQFYGVFLNETEVGHLIPWRFRDPKVADYFAMVVRVCAAEREGEDCAFFRDDPEFPLIERPYREAKRRARTTPLEVARALLDVMEAARPPCSRMALLQEVIARIADAPRPAPEARAAAPARSLSPIAGTVARVVERLVRDGPVTVPGVKLRGIEELGPPDERRIRLARSLA
ncbi:MAG: hypothetical protein HY906_02695, partial [Deltaproteobacteria bacterium]|nr:hypothetical protein [Deltaproteobacteria bacterium]